MPGCGSQEGRPSGPHGLFSSAPTAVQDENGSKTVLRQAHMMAEISDCEEDFCENWAPLPEPGFRILTRVRADRLIEEGGGKLSEPPQFFGGQNARGTALSGTDEDIKAVFPRIARTRGATAYKTLLRLL